MSIDTPTARSAWDSRFVATCPRYAGLTAAPQAFCVSVCPTATGIRFIPSARMFSRRVQVPVMHRPTLAGPEPQYSALASHPVMCPCGARGGVHLSHP